MRNACSIGTLYTTYHLYEGTNYNLISRVYRHGQIEYRTRQCVYFICIYRNTRRNSQSIRFEFSIIDRYSHDFFFFSCRRDDYIRPGTSTAFLLETRLRLCSNTHACHILHRTLLQQSYNNIYIYYIYNVMKRLYTVTLWNYYHQQNI